LGKLFPQLDRITKHIRDLLGKDKKMAMVLSLIRSLSGCKEGTL